MLALIALSRLLCAVCNAQKPKFLGIAHFLSRIPHAVYNILRGDFFVCYVTRAQN
jgi:hypothetical protein